MGIIFIKDIQSRLDKTISYIGNKKKTYNRNYEEIFIDLHNTLDYTVDDLKTEQKFFVDGINCRYENALKKMTDTKNEFHKTDKILGYHIIQSFAPGEGTPETIHELGKEFARRAFGDRFEVVVATHLNTGCLHNHYVLNSVSYIDGKKYYDTKDSYAHLRKISDELCREYGLSVIENPKKQSRLPYDLYMAEKNGEWTKDAIIKRDIDECILKTTSLRAFYNEMRKLGYSFNFDRKYPIISHPKFERPRRFKTLGEGYGIEDIERKLESKWIRYSVEIPEQENLAQIYFESLVEPSCRQVYVRFIDFVTYVKQNHNTNRQVDKYLVEEMRKLDKFIEQQNLMIDKDLETLEQVAEYKNASEKELSELAIERNMYRNELKVAIRNGDENKIRIARNAISEATERMKILRKEIRICDRIQEQEPKFENKINEIMNNEERKEMTTDERFRRCSRTNREDDVTRC